MKDTRYLYKCKHCNKQFMKESYFMAHTCKQMERSYEIQTLQGQQAYIAYKTWLEKQRRKPPVIETFASSQYYTGFYAFAGFVKDTGISDPETYIDLMVKAGISPSLWRRNESYAMYLEHMDKHADPFKQGEDTVIYIETLAERLGCPVSQVFDKLKYGEMLQLIQQRKLSPWFLFCSGAFKAWMAKLDSSEKDMLLKNIGINHWSIALEKRTDVVESMREVAKALGL